MQRRGWTLFEVVALTAMVASVAVVAIPWVSKRIDQSRTRVAIDNIDKLVRASAVYISTPLVDPSGLPLQCQFPGPAPVTPADSCCGGSADGDDDGECDPDPKAWDAPTWRALGFAVTEPHRFVYSYAGEGTGDNARFAATAQGDLDCDGQRSTFERTGSGVRKGKDRCTLRLAPAFTIRDRLE